MNTKVLLVGHGSRGPGGNAEVLTFAKQWQDKVEWPVEVCYLEFADRLLPEGLRQAAQGVERVVVLPLILNAAGHVKMEIPLALEQARIVFPQTRFLLAPHLGANEAILTLLLRRLRQGMEELHCPDPKTTGVILLGRGSSDAGANSEVAKMARWLFEETAHELVEIAFTGITYPRLETVVQRLQRLGMSQVVILPYYLFTGRLIERIHSQVERLQGQYPQIAFALGNYFGFAAEINQLMSQRLDEALAETPQGILACEGCSYRKKASLGLEHSHSHNHEHGHGHASRLQRAT